MATPSDNAIKRRSSPDVKKKAPIQSTFEAWGKFGSLFFLGGSFGITNIAAVPAMNAAPAITKNTTFQFAYSEIIPAYIGKSIARKQKHKKNH
jgi:hypothetical protein